MSGRITDPDVRILACVSAQLQGDYADDDLAWEGSPFAWLRRRPSRQRGSIGEQLVAGWCAARNLNVARAPDSECDRLIESYRTEIKFSTLWASGGYKFQQFRDQRYDMAICLGVTPFDAHCWVIPKHILEQYVIGHTPQHGGRAGTDTAWLSVRPEAPPGWLTEWGGRLSQAFDVLRRLTGAP